MSNSVLLLTQYMSTGGLERMVLQHALTLKEQKVWRPFVFAYDNSLEEADLYPTYQRELIPTVCYKKKKGFSFSTVWHIFSFCAANQIRVVHTHDIGPLLYASLAKLLSLGRLKIIHTQHSFAHLHERKRNKVYERFFTFFATKLCVVSSALVAEYERLGVQKEIKLIPNGVSFTHNQRASFEQRKLNRLQLNYAGREKNIPRLASRRWLLCLGRISEAKGQATVLELWNLLPQDVRSKWALLFIGPEKSEGFIHRLQKELKPEDSVLFLPATQEPHKWLLQADLFISASKFEGMPLTVVEALGYGLPCILSEIPGHALFQKEALFFPLQNSMLASQCLEVAMKNAEVNSLRVDQAAIREKFSARKMTEQYSEQYDALLNPT